MKYYDDCLQQIISNNIKIMTKKHNYYLYLASLNAYKSNMNKNYGAVLVCNNKIIGVGHNHSIDYVPQRYNYICKDRKQMQNIHAEYDAILNAIKNGNKKLISKSDIYISRVLNNYDININKEIIFQKAIPCEKCKQIIEKYNIKKTYYIY